MSKLDADKAIHRKIVCAVSERVTDLACTRWWQFRRRRLLKADLRVMRKWESRKLAEIIDGQNEQLKTAIAAQRAT